LRQKILLLLLGVCLFLVLFEAGLRLAGFINLVSQRQRNSLSGHQADLRILCIGESTTAGQYPVFLEEILNARNTGIRFSVIDKGIIGAHTGLILRKLEDFVIEYKPDMVVAMLGINDLEVLLPYNRRADSKIIRFIQTLKTYKFTSLLCLHMVARIGERQLLRDMQAAAKNGRGPQASRNAQHKESSAEASYTEQASAYLAEGKLVQATEQFVKALELNPRNYAANSGMGWVCLNLRKYAEAERFFKAAIRLGPDDDLAYLGLARLYGNQKKHYQARDLYSRILKQSPYNDNALVGLGCTWIALGDYAKAEEFLKKAASLNPENDSCLVELGWLYGQKQNLDEAKEYLNKAIALNPKNIRAYNELSRIYTKENKLTQAKEAMEKTIALNPESSGAYVSAGWYYQNAKDFPRAEESFKQAKHFGLHNEWAYTELAWLYQDQARLDKAEEVLLEGIRNMPESIRLYSALSLICDLMGKPEPAQRYAQEAEDLRQRHTVTAQNYRKIKFVLERKGITLVCVQYPLRSLEPLKRIFDDQTGMIFVDNERVFKAALKNASYRSYFVDMFAGDFGHCTQEGNRLLAENIANTIIKEVFYR